MIFFVIMFLIVMLMSLFFIDYLAYDKPLCFMISQRKIRLTEIKQLKQEKLKKLKAKNLEKYNFKIKKLRQEIRTISADLKLLEEYKQIESF